MADVLEQFFGGGKTTTAPSVITDQILDRLKMVESSGDRFALNKESKAMGAYQFMPEQVQTMHKQGVEFNPFNEKESRQAAKTYLEKLVKEKGSIEKALAAYGGFVTKDPTAYVNKVLQAPTTAQTTSPQAPQAVSSDPLEAFFSGKTPKAAPAVSAAPATTEPNAPDQATTEQPSKVKSLVGNILGTGLEMKRQVPGFLASAADVVASAPSAIASTIGYGAGRLFGLSPEQATEASQKVAGAISEPVGRMTGLSKTPAYREALPTQLMEYIGKNIGEGAQSIAQKFGLPVADVENAINATMMAGGAVAPKVVKGFKTAAAELQAAPAVPSAAPVAKPGMVSAGAAIVPDATTIKQALSVATPELQQAISAIPVDKVNIPTLQRHIEADTLPIPVRLTEGQATGDVVKLSNEQNRRGKDPMLAQRFNEQNGQLVENLGLIREKAAPDVYGTKKIENSQGLIDAYKELDSAKTADITKAYKALEDANGGQFPVDGVKLATNAEAMLGKKLKTEFLPSSIKSQLERFKSGEPMTFEQFEAMRTNLAAEIRKAERSGDGNAAQASSIVRQALEDLPMQGSAAAALKPLADSARSLAKQRFDMLKKDPAYKAAVDDLVPADKFIDKFVVNGVNKNINTMVEHLGRDSPAHQHMAAGTVNWLKDKAGIVDETGNFSQAGYNKALKQLDDVKNLNAIFNQEAASQLKTLGNVARYTQAQPRGAFVNNSNTLVGSLAEKASNLAQSGVEKGLNVAVPGLQLGTSVMEMRARRAAEAETRKALETGAGTKQSGKNKVSDLGK
jgi:hypothetical protein